MQHVDSELDARGLNCPLPVLRLRNSMQGLASGQILRVMATDPGSVKDFESFCNQTGNELLESTEANGEFIFLLKIPRKYILCLVACLFMVVQFIFLVICLFCFLLEWLLKIELALKNS